MCDDEFLGLMCDLSEGKIVSYNESNFNRVGDDFKEQVWMYEEFKRESE